MTPTEYATALSDGTITLAQGAAMEDLQRESGIPWPEFLANCQPPTLLSPYVGVHDFHGMFVGIEPDGYTHT